MIVGAGILAACTVAPIERPTPAAEATPATTEGISDLPANADEVIRENMRGLLARQLQVAPGVVAVVAAAPTEWPDACLGAGAPAEACAQVVTPGYVVTLRVDGQEYTYHTDPGGYSAAWSPGRSRRSARRSRPGPAPWTTAVARNRSSAPTALLSACAAAPPSSAASSSRPPAWTPCAVGGEIRRLRGHHRPWQCLVRRHRPGRGHTRRPAPDRPVGAEGDHGGRGR